MAALVAAMPLAARAQETPVLTVHTYDSFVSEWGPGPAIETGFEATCGCDLRFVAVGDGAALLSRLRLEGARTRADVVLGLDTALTADAAATGLFAPHGIAGVAYDLPVEWDDPLFVPYDWGWFAFVHRADFVPPTSLAALADGDARIIVQDPRTSTPGLGLLLWVKDAYGDDAEAMWEGLADNIVTVTQGWSEAYALFLQGESDMVLSYTTSPAYHLIAEGDPGFAAAPFDEGHYLQVEVAGIVATSPRQALARDFLRYLQSDAVQTVIPTTNWMYPAVMPAAGLPDGFDDAGRPHASRLIPPAEVPAIRDPALAEWLRALRR
jgi:thiamine transport system substrate-binding protein